MDLGANKMRIAILFLLFAANCAAQCSEIKLQADADGASAYFFSASLPIISSDGSELVIDRSDADSVHVHLIVHSENGCIAEYDTVIYLDPCSDFWIPNSFTPNSDRINDYFKPITSLSYRMNIFNRWGEIIFSGTEWDGSYMGRIVEDGVYTWQLFISRNIYYGRVTLIQ